MASDARNYNPTICGLFEEFTYDPDDEKVKRFGKADTRICNCFEAMKKFSILGDRGLAEDENDN